MAEISPIRKIYQDLGDGELMTCMEEIIELQATGFLKVEEGKCREVQSKLEVITGKNNTLGIDFNLRNILDEMARRWYETKKYELENFAHTM